MPAPFQPEFAAALLDPARAVPSQLAAAYAETPSKRFAVYRNNVTVGLIGALAVRFPATQKIVGEEFFAETARVFVRAHPPRSPLLMFYGDKFPDFLAGFDPVADLPYLPDVARLEAARTHAFHAADAAPLDPAALQAIEPARLNCLHVTPHPAARIVRSEHPIVTIWAMNSGERELGQIDDWRGEDALVVRPELDVRVIALPPGGAAFLQALFAGAPLGEAAEAALAAREDFDLVANLAGLFASGALQQAELSA